MTRRNNTGHDNLIVLPLPDSPEPGDHFGDAAALGLAGSIPESDVALLHRLIPFVDAGDTTGLMVECARLVVEGAQ